MFQRLAVMVLLASVICFAQPARADENCQASCPEGKVKSSFLDGQHISCICVDPGSPMDQAYEEPPSGGEGQEGEA